MNLKERLDKTKEYIDEFYYDEISLELLAKKCNSSKYYFNRNFTKEYGISPIRYLTKIRLKTALELLIRSEKTIAEIAGLVGFNSISGFYNSFVKEYNSPPGIFKKDNCRNMLEVNSNIGEEIKELSGYPYAINNFFRKVWGMKVLIKEFPDQDVAYVRKVGSYIDGNIDHWHKLVRWSNENGLYPSNSRYIGASLDDAYEVPEDKCRHDACVTIPEVFNKEEHSEVEYKTLKGGLYGVYIFYDTVDKLPLAFNNLYKSWLPDSGFQLDFDNRPALDIPRNNSQIDPVGKSRIDICIPIKLKN